MGTPLRVLSIEDSEDDALLILRDLQRGGFDPLSKRVDTPEALESELDRENWDLVIADYMMPRFNGLEALRLMQGKGLDLPFIIVSGHIEEETAVAAFVQAIRIAGERFMEDALGAPLIPNWNRVTSAFPSFFDRLTEAVVEDDKTTLAATA